MQKPSASTLIPILIIVSIIAGGLFFLFKPQNDTIRPFSQKENQQTPLTTLGAQQPNPAQAPNQDVEKDGTQFRQAPMETTAVDPCLAIIKDMDHFFVYLDSQDYILQYQFPNGSKEYITSVVNKALSHPPTPTAQGITGAYLYRTIGGQNLRIFNTILQNEPDHLETVFADFFTWSATMAGQCQNRTYSIRPQLNQLYRYAVFFIDSKAGQSYVKRRNDLTGLLTRFYAVQIIHEAQIQHIDTYNTDLSALITPLITDIESTDLLANKTGYLKTLYTLRDVQP